jgi:hypothetical protein
MSLKPSGTAWPAGASRGDKDMGTILASTLIAEARNATFDTVATYRWSDAAHLAILNAGQRQAAIYKPDISVNNAAVQLVAGTKQSIPSGATALIKLTRNMGTDGSTPGRTISVEDFELFSQHNPYWHMHDASAEVRYLLFDKKDPARFYVYPPQPSSNQGYVEQVYAVPPTDIASVGAAINLDDVYYNALLDYDIYRISQNEANINPFAPARELKHWNLFVTALGRLDLLRDTRTPKKDEEK